MKKHEEFELHRDGIEPGCLTCRGRDIQLVRLSLSFLSRSLYMLQTHTQTLLQACGVLWKSSLDAKHGLFVRCKMVSPRGETTLQSRLRSSILVYFLHNSYIATDKC